MSKIVVVMVTLSEVGGCQKVWIDACCTSDGKDVLVLNNLSEDDRTEAVTIECFDAEEFNKAGRGGDCEAVSSRVLNGDEWRELESEGDVTALMKSQLDAAEADILRRRHAHALALGVTPTMDFITRPSGAPDGYPMCVRLIMPGDGYGMWTAETKTWAMTLPAGSAPLVEFFDKRYMHTPFGQFTGGRYHLETMANAIKKKGGLLLDGGIPEWAVDAASMQLVGKFLAPAIERFKLEALKEVQSKSVDVVFDAHSTGYMRCPAFARRQVDQAFLDQLARLQRVCIDYGLDQVRMKGGPDVWGPDDVMSDRDLSNPFMIVTSTGFWFTDQSGFESVQTREVNTHDFIDKVERARMAAKSTGEVPAPMFFGESANESFILSLVEEDGSVHTNTSERPKS